MFIVRPFKSTDLPVLQEIYKRKGFDFQLPEMTDFSELWVAADEGTDRPIGILAAKPIRELMWFLDDSWGTPRARWEVSKDLHEHMLCSMRAIGVKEVSAWLPPELEKSFGRRLMRKLGWIKPLWPNFSRKIEG